MSSNPCATCSHGDWNDHTGACAECDPAGKNWEPIKGPRPIKTPVRPLGPRPFPQYQMILPLEKSHD